MTQIPPCGCASPGTSDPSTCYCSVEELLAILRKRYSLAVLRTIYARPACRYADIAEAVSLASSSTLAEVLHALEAARLVTRDAEGPHPLYSATESGAKLVSRLRALLEEVQAS